MSALKNDPNHLFTLHFSLPNGYVTIHAWDARHTEREYGHRRIDCELWFRDTAGRRCIFPRGATYCALPAGTELDSIAGRELVTSLFAMRPGDTDDEYFQEYTAEQLAWAEANGEELGVERDIRYCDENGNLKEEKS